MATDIVERLRETTPDSDNFQWLPTKLLHEAADQIERLQGLLRSEGANRYWEGRWRDADAEIERLRRAVEKFQALDVGQSQGRSLGSEPAPSAAAAPQIPKQIHHTAE